MDFNMAIAPSQAPAKSESNDFAPAQQILIICHDSEKIWAANKHRQTCNEHSKLK